MSEDILLDFLHMEFVSLMNKLNGEKSTDVSKQENVGFDVGFRFIEKYTREWNRFKDELDVIKFVCKEFWSAIFGKQADTLRTNHQGIYVLIDNQFRFVLKVSQSPQYVNYLAFSCGLIRGALSNLGINSVVTAEVLTPPSIKFQIQIQAQN